MSSRWTGGVPRELSLQRRKRTRAWLFTACWCTPLAAFAQSPALSPEAAQQINAAAEAWRAKSKAPALSIAVVRDIHPSPLSNGYGLADPENNVQARSDTVYRLASLTKSLTAVAVMQLAEEEKLELDAPIQKYVLMYPGKRWTVTPRQLLTHTAGVRHNKWRVDCCADDKDAARAARNSYTAHAFIAIRHVDETAP